ncbi:hypothetical protein [Marinilabilia rubra]|uniref:Uncharacterized protein n=1 Tax=Marinilabilia rubra TaxID=2162893 RepID=A0A2U2BE76_9BACT|nr:hypothetical protein [Marinilabilia rubra]PWE01372.1 hypothetical protein DDZ16_02485 [Marinilabilia rubra]
MRELDALRKWVELVQEMNQWPHYSDWNNHQFRLLSDEISEKAGVRIDRNTVRKVVDNVNNGKVYSPHISTKDALALYIGKKDWEHFEKSITRPEKQIKGKLFFITAVAAVFSFIAFLYLINNDDEPYYFAVKNPEGVIPHTVVCNFNLKKLKDDEVYIDYGHVNQEGNYVFQEINKNSVINKHCFHFPGYYNIRLFVDGKVKNREKSWINSPGWFIYAIDATSYLSKHEVPEMVRKAGLPLLQHIPFNAILEKQTTDDGHFFIPEEKIMDINGQAVNHHLHLRNFKPFGVDMQNALFSIRFKDDDFGEGINCSEAAVYLHCEHGDVGFKFAQKGCERYTHRRIGDDFKAGRVSDLDYLILNYKQFRTISVRGSGDEVTLLVDGKELKSFSVQQQFGEIRGMHFWFKGSTYIDYVRLADNEGQLVFSEEFE